MKKLIAFSLVALFAGSVMANVPQQANNNVAPQVSKDKDKKGHHHRHHHEHKPNDKK